MAYPNMSEAFSAAVLGLAELWNDVLFLVGGLLPTALPGLPPLLGGLDMTLSPLLDLLVGGLFLTPLALLGGLFDDDIELALPGRLLVSACCFLADLTGLTAKIKRNLCD